MNKRLFMHLNDKVFSGSSAGSSTGKLKVWKATTKMSEENRRLKQEMELFAAALKLLLTIVSGLQSREDLDFIIDSLNSEKFIFILQSIFHTRIMPKKDAILMDEDCGLHESSHRHANCTEDFCFFGKVTHVDNFLISIGFNIFILFYYLRNVVPKNREKLMAFFIEADASELDYEEDEEEPVDFNRIDSIVNKR